MAWDDVYAIVRAIPPGKVLSYGDVTRRVERPLSPRAIGWALADCPDDVPWQRVVRTDGSIATDEKAGMRTGRQRRLLEREGVAFDAKGRVAMKAHRWE